MLRLILKDLRVAALFLWILLPVYAVLALGPAMNVHAHFWVTLAMAFSLMMTVPTLEWYQGSDIFVSTLPVDRTLLVKGRYGTSTLALLASLLAGAYPLVMLAAAGVLVDRGWPAWANPLTGLEFVASGVLVVAVSHPVLFRWGLAPAVVTGVLTVGALAGGALLAGTGTSSLQTIDMIGTTPMAPLIRLMVVRGGLVPTVALVAALGALVLAASARLSMAWAKGREW